MATKTNEAMKRALSVPSYKMKPPVFAKPEADELEVCMEWLKGNLTCPQASKGLNVTEFNLRYAVLWRVKNAVKCGKLQLVNA